MGTNSVGRLVRASTLGAALALLAGCAIQGERLQGAADDGFGVLVMAHGGSSDWNAAVSNAVAPLRDEYPVEIAFGMADAASLQDAVERLEAQDVTRIGVVRLFVSGESFLERTEQILGLAPGAPARPAGSEHDGHGAHAGHGMAFWRVDTRAAFALSAEGLNEASEIGAVLLERARTLARDPEREDVLLIAHGTGDDAENALWLERIDGQADAIRAALPFHAVRVATLREDWPEKRAAAEAEIRRFVQESAAAGRRAIVIPYRVEGFGPYARVLEGLEYVADGRGLLPHESITRWIARQAEELRAARPALAVR